MLHDALALLNCIHIADFYTFQGLQGDYQCYAMPYILSVRGSWLGSSSMVFPMLVSSLADRHTSPVLWCTLVSGIQGPEDRSLCSWEPKLASVAIYNTSLLLALFPLGEEAKPVHHVHGWKCHSSTHRSVCWPKNHNGTKNPGTSWSFAKYKPLEDKIFKCPVFILLPGSTSHPNSTCPATPSSHVQNKSQLSDDHRPVGVVTTWYHLTWRLLSQLLATRNFNVTVLAEELILRYLPDELSDRKRIHDEEMLELSK